MKVYYPFYYNDFKCIADKCRHSCCVGWEISVDEPTLKKYEDLCNEDILPHIDDGVIKLCDDGRCPFLCDDGLCIIISRFGEDYTSVICREHPRFYHRTGDRIECGIGASCEEACRLILSSDFYGDFVLKEREVSLSWATDFDAISHREYIYSVLSDGELTYNEKIELIKEKYSIPEIYTDGEWCEIFDQLEYLDEDHRGIFTLGGVGELFDIYCRFLAYLIFRHLSVAENYENLRARLGFCLLVTRLLESFTVKNVDFNEICDFARIISEEIEYSEDNTDQLIFEFEANML